ncbi:MAG: hypothetical protein ACE5JA_10370 [bacterium]
MPEDQFEQMFEQLVKARGPQWERFLEGLAPDRVGQAEHFLHDQRRLLRAADQTKLDILRMDSTEQDWVTHAEKVIKFWGL